MIDVTQTDKGDPMQFEVVVTEGSGRTRHRVTAAAGDIARLAAPGATPEAVIEASFRFLLDREPKESILGRFDLTVISRYFPDHEAKLAGYFARSS